jgi:hypothetical protein
MTKVEVQSSWHYALHGRERLAVHPERYTPKEGTPLPTEEEVDWAPEPTCPLQDSIPNY